MDEIGRCRNCRYWKPFGAEGQSFAGPKPAGACDNPDLGAFMSGYVSDAVLATYEDFGCVQFEVKP